MVHKRWIIFIAVVLLASATGWAGNGSMLHGVGPVSESMGGAGVGLPMESLGALAFNPALMTGYNGNQVSFAMEFFQDYPRIDLNAKGFSGRTNPTIELGVIPAFGWMAHAPNSKIAIGFGLIGIAGFRTDYPSDNASILFSQPPSGYGRIYTDYSLTKIPFALAYQATPKLSIGASFVMYRGTLAIAPLPASTFDQDAAGNKFFEQGSNVIAQWTAGGQLGLYYQATKKVSFGFSYTSPQVFHDWEWNSTVADPGSPRYGQPRILKFNLDGPGYFGFGTGLKLSPKVDIALDGEWIEYTNVEGFGGTGGVDLATHTLTPFGWRNIWVLKTGVQYHATQKLDVRLGFNWGQTPIRQEIVLASTGTPTTFQKHFCGGFSMKLMPNVTADAGIYFVPREHVKGPSLDINTGVVPNSTYDMSNRLISGQVAFNFHF